jgi:hypothetical protein
MHSRRNTIIRRRQTAFAVALVLAMLSAAGGAYWSVRRQQDLGDKPPGLVFRRVFGVPPPAGTHELRVAGMSSLAGDLWMRLRVDDVHAFLLAMGRNTLEPLTLSPMDLSASVPPARSEADRDRYAREVGWDSVYAVGHPECYVFQSNPPGHGWFGQMVLDRAQRQVYIHGSLM